jgi:hypothetical protein
MKRKLIITMFLVLGTTMLTAQDQDKLRDRD